ncbi:MAG TPA: Phenylacetic acid catabolic protein, partial [Gaiellaceae bacterium]|nr:Phenylacetic acid catabolic protein [Gaiellaceae bacterium]
MSARAQRLLEIADDELILGWRDSEWTGIAPSLEEDVAFSSIAQNEIGHARALYELAARELDTDPDALALDRSPDENRNAQLVELRRL